MNADSYEMVTRRRIIAGAGIAVTVGLTGCSGARQETSVVYVERGVFESITEIDTSHPFGSLNLDSFWVTISPQTRGVEILVTDGNGHRETAAALPAGRTVVTVNRPGTWSFPVDIEARNIGGELLGHAKIVEVA